MWLSVCVCACVWLSVCVCACVWPSVCVVVCGCVCGCGNPRFLKKWHGKGLSVESAREMRNYAKLVCVCMKDASFELGSTNSRALNTVRYCLVCIGVYGLWAYPRDVRVCMALCGCHSATVLHHA